jgi:hypothetical protein
MIRVKGHVAALLTLIYGCIGCERQANSTVNSASFRTLSKADHIETYKIGEAANVSGHYIALTNLMSSTNAVLELRALFDHSASLSGKLYTLYGLSVLDKPSFDEFSHRLKGSRTVTVLNYCVWDTITVKDFLSEVSDGRMARKLPFKEGVAH